MAWTVGAARDLPIEDGDSAWDGPAAEKSIFDHAGGDDFDPAKARRGFLVYNDSEPKLKGSYKLPIARVRGGVMRVPKSALRAAASYLPQTHDLPAAVRARAQAVLDAYMDKAGIGQDDGDDDSDKADRPIRRKASAAPSPGSDPFEFVMSDASVDRMGDVIEQGGWELANFKKNPVALFGHSTGFPIGKWLEVGVHDGRLTGYLDLMPPVSERLAEIHAAVKAGVLRAVSVGFHPLDMEPLEGSKSGGYRFMRQELVECSLVAVPANPNALSIARSIGISREGQRLIFGDLADHGQTLARRGPSGDFAFAPQIGKPAMTTLSDRIQASQAQVTLLRDTLSQHLTQSGDDLDEHAIQRSDELNAQIDGELKRLETLTRAEYALGSATHDTPARPAHTPSTQLAPLPPARPFAMPKQKEDPGHLIWRTGVITLLSHITKKSANQIIAERYGQDEAQTRAVYDWMTRAASNPATVPQAGWAADLVRIQYGEWFGALMPKSIYGPLSGMSFRGSLNGYGQLNLPTRLLSPAIAGSFVGEGQPIPVRQGQFNTIIVGLKKMAVITTYTREIAEHSTPQIEGLLRQMVQEDTSISVDTILIDTNPATTIRPAGLRSAVAGLTPTAGGGFTALVGDLKQLVGALASVNALIDPVWIFNDRDVVSISLTQTALGAFPFAAEVDRGMLLGYPIIKSTTMPAGTVIFMNASDLVTIEGDEPRFEVSDQATLHMEDTTPLAISTVGTPNVVAAPVRSLWQTDTLGLRMILPMNWALRRSNTLAWITGITWE